MKRFCQLLLITFHSFSVTLFALGPRLFLIQLQINTEKMPVRMTKYLPDLILIQLQIKTHLDLTPSSLWRHSSTSSWQSARIYDLQKRKKINVLWEGCLRAVFLMSVEGRRDRWSGWPPDWGQWTDSPWPSDVCSWWRQHVVTFWFWVWILGNILTKTPALRITLNIDDVPSTSRSHTHPSHLKFIMNR